MSDPVSIRVILQEDFELKNLGLEENTWSLFLFTALELTPYLYLCPCEFNLFITNDEGIRPYNQEYRNKDYPTNVLSFPINEKNEHWHKPPQGVFILGDIIMNWQAVERESKEQKRSPHFHFLHLLVHGFLHLLHYDHCQEEEAKEMESFETQVFIRHGLPDPYSIIPHL